MSKMKFYTATRHYDMIVNESRTFILATPSSDVQPSPVLHPRFREKMAHDLDYRQHIAKLTSE